ncbi:hypothetical protein ABLE94_15380 [Gordonia sp. VNK1]|uniref:hypothetical protein n=1 Tax=Gordonia oleivorans TaxID=3156618 RepID=UPI0032B4AD89
MPFSARPLVFRRAVIASLVTSIAVATLTGCSDNAEDPTPPTAVAESSALSPASSATTAQQSISASAPANLRASFDRLDIPSNVGVALAPVGGGPVISFGDQTPRVAWSTIKVPLSIAALRKSNSASTRATVRTTIINSDNEGALTLRRSLGTPDQARVALTKVFRDLGDETTQLVRITEPDETFGLTVWPLASAATFASHLPCESGDDFVVSLMGQVAGNQQWGVEVMPAPKATAVKGGWGPGDEGGYEVRQLGLITHADGRQTAVTMGTYTPGETFEAGTAVLDKVAAWLNKNLTKLPSGTCA